MTVIVFLMAIFFADGRPTQTISLVVPSKAICDGFGAQMKARFSADLAVKGTVYGCIETSIPKSAEKS